MFKEYENAPEPCYKTEAEGRKGKKQQRPEPLDEEEMRETPVTVPTLEKPGSEDSCDKLKLDLLQYQLADVGKTLIFNGTGYGLTTMSDTVPLSLKRYGHHISLYNRYQALSSVENEQQVDQTAKQKLVFFMHNLLAYVKIDKYFHSNDVGC